ncbi:MAG TPA: alpha/beta fold hydrolase [Burkholderiales bacterium]|nr:alpha/beta fold hydrolase [Burkholderiales bacterium]
MDTMPVIGGERTLDEVKKEVLRRAAHHSPFEGVRRDDVEKIVGGLTSLDRDHWAEQWCKVGLAYEVRADALEKQAANGKEVGDTYFLAFNYCSLGRYPVASTPGKKEAYKHSLRMFRKAAKYFDPPLQIVDYPCGDLKLTGYLQVPRGVAKPPVVLHWGGVDGWKENRQHASAVLHRLGLATFTIDMPGTGEHPVKYIDPRAEQTYSAAIDLLTKRTDIDGSRIAVWGGSFGGYWAARLAYTEAKRLRGAVFHGSNVHYGFQREWLTPALTKTASTYLFGPASLFEARSTAMGVKTLEEFLAAAPKLSLKDMGLLDQPSAPILGINGKLDDQAPVQDIYLLMEHGSPKEARIYPEGGHMGRTPGKDASEITETIAAWLKGKLSP